MRGEVRRAHGYNNTMSRRYVSPDQATVEQDFDLVRSGLEFPVNFNVAPTHRVPVIRVIDDQPDLALLGWGFGDPVTYSVGIEALNLSAADSGLLARGQRCIIPTLGYYVWQVDRGARRPFYVQVEDQRVFGFAGFWERESCLIITQPANALLASVDNSEGRMPVILGRDLRDVWLYGSAFHAAGALAPYPSERMVAYPVSVRIDSLESNDEKLIEPLETNVD